MTMPTIIDPTDDNVAIVDGKLSHALRIAKVADPARPTVAELSSGQIIGYGNLG